MANFNAPVVDDQTAQAAGYPSLQAWRDTTGRTAQDAQDKATATYKAGIDSAVSTLSTAGTNLDTQYKGLLDKVLGQGTVAMNTATTGENNLLGMRGITNN